MQKEQRRQIVESKSFISALNKYFVYKSKNYEDIRHARLKYEEILRQIIVISRLKKYPYKKVNYKNSKELQYFTFEQHAVFFSLSENKMHLKYFVSTKRIKKSLV